MEGRAKRLLTGEVLLVVALTGLALLLRLWRMADESPWWDEVASLQYLDAGSLLDFLRRERQTDPAMTPVYFTLQYLWARLFGDSPLHVRMLSVLFGTLSIPLIYMLGKRLFSKEAGFAAAALLAVSLSHIHFSQEIRVYALVIFLATASVYCLVRALDDGRYGWWLLYGAANALLAFTHLFVFFLFAAQGLYLLFTRYKRVRLMGAWTLYHVLLLACVAMWLTSANMPTIATETSWISDPGLREAAMLFVIMAGGRATNEDPTAHLPTGVSADLVIAVLIAMLTARALIPHKHAKPNSALLVGSWLLVPPALLLAVSYALWPSFVYRYVLYIAPALCLIAGEGYAMIPGRRMRAAFVVLMALLFANQLSGLAVGPVRPDWRGVGDYLEQNAGRDDLIIAFQGINGAALKFNSSLSDDQLLTREVWSELAGPAGDACKKNRNVWIVLWLWTDTENIESDLAAQGLKFTHKDFKGWPNLRVYSILAKDALIRE